MSFIVVIVGLELKWPSLLEEDIVRGRAGMVRFCRSYACCFIIVCHRYESVSSTAVFTSATIADSEWVFGPG